MGLARNTALNLLGLAVPLLVALVVVPGLIARLAPAGFGFLALAWALVGYFSLFDLGFSRVLTRAVAEARGDVNSPALRALCRSALSISLGLGIVAGTVLFLGANWICGSLLRIPSTLVAEATHALRVLAICVPIVTLTAALRGMLEGGQQFGWINFLRGLTGILGFAGPAVVTLYTTDMTMIAVVLVGIRAVSTIGHWWVAKASMARLVGFGVPEAGPVKAMLSYGIWITVSNIAGPIIVYADRFMIAGVAGIAAVGLYAVPFEVVTKLWLFPAALSTSLFPLFAMATENDTARTYRSGIKAIILAVGPLAVAGALFAPEWLTFWLGQEFARGADYTTKILSIGVMATCVAYVPLALLQARGRADLPAKVHLVLLPVYIVGLALALNGWGIEGAALVWALRNLLDAGALCWLCASKQLVKGAIELRSTLILGMLLLAGVAGVISISAIQMKWLFFIVYVTAFATLYYSQILEQHEKAWIKSFLKSRWHGH
jgi:O-antigen/teichoic acid export membrane protein